MKRTERELVAAGHQSRGGPWADLTPEQYAERCRTMSEAQRKSWAERMAREAAAMKERPDPAAPTTRGESRPPQATAVPAAAPPARPAPDPPSALERSSPAPESRASTARLVQGASGEALGLARGVVLDALDLVTLRLAGALEEAAAGRAIVRLAIRLADADARSREWITRYGELQQAATAYAVRYRGVL